MYQLRYYQQECVDAIWENMQCHCVASLPTGAGKTPVIAELINRCLQYDNTHCLVLTHKRELVKQNYETLVKHINGVNVGMYCAGLRQRKIRPVTIASVQSIINAKHEQEWDIIIVDEAHLVPAGTSGQFHVLFKKHPDARIIGLTATPYRMTTGMLHEGDEALFDALVYEAKTSKLIEEGFLSPIRSKSSKIQADLSSVHTRGGEFIEHEMQNAMDKEEVTRAAVKDMILHASNRKSIMVFCAGITHAEHVHKTLTASGVTGVEIITEKTSGRDRAKAVERFKSGEMRVLVNVGIFTTGFDAPNVDCIVMLRATKSPGLYVQIVGRGLRKCEGKSDCLFLDYGGNIQRFGPLDEITSKSASNGERAAPVKTCPDCDTVVKIQVMKCPDCGHIWTREESQKIPHGTEASDLDPIKPTVIERFPVTKVVYHRHKKTGKPDSVRVEYYVNLYKTYSEWLCPEHSSKTRNMTREWLARRGVYPSPSRVDDILKITDKILSPKGIVVRLSGNYPQVIGYEWNEAK